MADKISQAIRCCWHVCKWGWVGLNVWESFGRVNCGKVNIVILLDLLHEMIRFDRYVEKQGLTHCSNRVCLGWDEFGNSIIPIHMHIRNLWNLRILSRVSQLTYLMITITYKWLWVREIVCRIVIGCVDVSWVLHCRWLL